MVGIPNRTQRQQFWLDTATVVIGFSTIIWYFLILPIAGAEYNSTLELVLSEIYPAADIWLLFGATLMILQHRYLLFRPALALLLASIVVFFTADCWFVTQNLQGTYTDGGITDWFYVTSFMLMTTGAHVERMSDADTGTTKTVSSAYMHTIDALPYVAILLTFGLILYVVRDRLHEPLGGLIAAAIILTLLIMARQILSLRLLREIEVAITIAKNEAERASQAKSEFLSRMSHELRTPLHSILGFAQALEGHASHLTGEEKQSLQNIRKSGQHLLELINEVLDLTRIDAGRLELFLEDVDLLGVLTECLSLVRGMADKKNLAIYLKEAAPLTVYAVRTRLKEVLLNLLSNAIKYNREQGSITVECAAGTDQRVRVLVTDTGRGIPEDQQERVFQPFTRIHRKDSEIEGTGIGLTISKRLIEAMGGEMGFSSAADTGSTFWFELKAGRKQTRSRSQAEVAVERRGVTSVTPAARGKVLYIEDTPANVQLMHLIVKRLPGVELLDAQTAELGIALAKKVRPDLILMDIDLPGMDGIEALKVLREDRETQDIPVIAISAAAMGHDIERIQQAGFDDHLNKPYNIQEVPSSLAKYLY
jgi:signal transduction histidine kinase/CheY-like chemotaxis protein